MIDLQVLIFEILRLVNPDTCTIVHVTRRFYVGNICASSQKYRTADSVLEK